MTHYEIGDQRRLSATFRNALGFLPTDIDLANDTITITAHGLSDGDAVRLVSTGNLPADVNNALLLADTDYFVVNKTTDNFKIALTPGGTAINLTTVGTGAHTAGVVTDPTTVTFLMTEPDGTLTTYVNGTNAENVKDSTGRFHVDWTIDQAGRHHWKFLGVGALVQAEGASFVALRSDT